MITKTTYQKAGVADIPVLVENRIRFALELSGPQPEEAVAILRNQMTDYFAKAIDGNTCVSIIARCGEDVAGIGSVQVREQPGNFKNPSGRWGYIMNMYTVPAFRRKGICRTILSALLEEGEKLGLTAYELHATPTGEFVYRQEGFEIHPEPTYRNYLGLHPDPLSPQRNSGMDPAHSSKK